MSVVPEKIDMLTLFVKTGCPYCAKVLTWLKEHHIPFTEKNIRDPKIVRELIDEGGKRQVPFLEDDNMTPYLIDDDTEMYESDKIVAYLEKKYGTIEPQSMQGVNLHVSDDSELCESCE